MMTLIIDRHAETWGCLQARHHRERLELIQQYASAYTIKDAAKILQMEAACLRRYAWHYNVKFLGERNGKTTATRTNSHTKAPQT